MVELIWSALVTVGLSGFGRAFIGWMKNSLEDGAVQSAEWKKLGVTLGIFLVIGFAAVLGQTITDTNLEVIGIGIAFLINEVWNVIQKKLAMKKAALVAVEMSKSKKVKK